MSYLTVAEARTKICPHMTYEWVQGGVVDTLRRNQESCHANDCMAWRWAGNLPSTEKGYCGLAGRPAVFEKDTE